MQEGFSLPWKMSALEVSGKVLGLHKIWTHVDFAYLYMAPCDACLYICYTLWCWQKIKPDKGSRGEHWHNVSPHLIEHHNYSAQYYSHQNIITVHNNIAQYYSHQNIVKREKGDRLEKGSKSCSNQQGALAPFKPGEVVDDWDLRMWNLWLEWAWAWWNTFKRRKISPQAKCHQPSLPFTSLSTFITR